MLRAALGDVGLTWLIYAAIAGISRRWRWTAGVWGWPRVGALLVLSVALAIAVESRALANGLWRYTAAAPLLPGTSISAVPVLQLVLLTPLVLVGADRIVERLAPRG